MCGRCEGDYFFACNSWRVFLCWIANVQQRLCVLIPEGPLSKKRVASGNGAAFRVSFQLSWLIFQGEAGVMRALAAFEQRALITE